MKEDADVKEILASLYREQKIIKNRGSLLLKIKEAWQEDPDFREQLREFVKTQPSDRPGRKPRIAPEKAESFIELSSKLGVEKKEAINILNDTYGLKNGSIEKSTARSRKK